VVSKPVLNATCDYRVESYYFQGSNPSDTIGAPIKIFPETKYGNPSVAIGF
jgi:hypothetical protein